jgi:hypothetical protein
MPDNGVYTTAPSGGHKEKLLPTSAPKSASTTAGVALRVARGLVAFVGVVAVTGVLAWSVVFAAREIRELQDRVERLERWQATVGGGGGSEGFGGFREEQGIQDYLDAKVDELVKQVRN